VKGSESVVAPFARQLYVMAKPAGANCNLRCQYCYYLEKSRLYGQEQRHVMSDELLEKFVKEYIEAQTVPQVLFTWHGGEPLLRPLAFYEKALRLQQQYARGRHIDNVIQTNGTLLTDEWCAFFRQHHFLVGVSVDGPQPLHDACRKTADGQSTFDRVMEGIRLLNKHGVEWNAMAVVNRHNAEEPLAFYRFFKDMGCHYIQFAPIVERCVSRSDGLTLAPGMQADGSLTDLSVTPVQWGRFLCTLFDEWVRHDVGEYFVQLFDATLANWVGEAPGVCTLSPECGNVGAMEYNGDLYSCDHFVFSEYRLGNLHEQTITEMMYSPQQRQFASMKRQQLPRQCRECRFLFACNGECPKNRFVNDCYGQPGLNYLCEGYHMFFSHVAPYMDHMKQLLEQGLPPADIMNML